jgi:uncharacterized caspase-like protein
VTVETLVNNTPDREATFKNIRDKLLWLTTSPEEFDVSLLYISGHGKVDVLRVGDASTSRGIYLFLPYDADERRQTTTLISYADISQYAENASGTRLLFLDTCNSGQVDATQLVVDLEKRSRSAFIFASSTGRQRSYELEKHGAFTQAFLEGFRGGADNARVPTGRVTNLGLADWLDRRVRQLTSDKQWPLVGGTRAHPALDIGVVVPEGEE